MRRPHRKRSHACSTRSTAIVERHGFQGLLTLRLIPLVPFNALNFGSGLMTLRWRTYAIATVVGILPGTAIYTFFADALLQGSQEASRDALARLILAGALLVHAELPARYSQEDERAAARHVNHGCHFVNRSCHFGEPRGCSAAPDPPSAQQLPDHGEFTGVLAAVVVGARVDYARLAADDAGLRGLPGPARGHRHRRRHQTLRPTSSSPSGSTRTNACMLKRVIEHYPIRRGGRPSGG